MSSYLLCPLGRSGPWSGALHRTIQCFLLLLAMAGGMVKSFADIIPPGCNGSGLGISLYADKQRAHIGDTITYSVIVYNFSPLPSLKVCQATEVTASMTTPDGTVRPITLNRTTLNPGDSDEYVAVATYVIRSQDIQTDGTLKATAQTQGRIQQNIVPSAGNAFQSLNTVVVRPCIDVTHTCQGGVGEAGVITYSGEVRNCGDTPLTGVTVTAPGGVVQIGDLAVGQSKPYNGSYVPADPCAPSQSTVVASGRDLLEQPLTVSSTKTATCNISLTPGLVLTANCPAEAVQPGQQVTYTGTVRNSGNVTLTNVVVVNSLSGSTPVYSVATLAPGQELPYSASYTAPADCSVASTLNASARSRCGVAVAAAPASINCRVATAPAIEITRACPANPVAAGSALNYTGQIRNTGNVTLQNLRVVSARNPATAVLTLAALAPGGVTNFAGSFIAPATGDCDVSDTLTVVAQDRCSLANITNSVTQSCPILTAPAISVTHDCPAVPVVANGSARYRGRVTNSGNVALNNVVVVDGGTTVFGPTTLAAGASAEFEGSFSAGANVCDVQTSVTATGNGVCDGRQVTSTSTKRCPVTTTPAISITSNCGADNVQAGGTVVYGGVIQNTGNVTLTDVIITGNGSGGSNVRILGPITLAPGATTNYTASYTAPANACSVTNGVSVTGRSQCNQTVASATAGSTCGIGTTPQIEITATCPATPTAPGANMVYTGTVRNPGNVALNNIRIVSDRTGETALFTIATLAPGATAAYTATVRAGTNICDQATTFTASATDNCGGRGVNQSITRVCPVVSTPSVAVTHDCPATAIEPGATGTFTGTVRNTGNITLTNVTVVSGGVTVFGPAILNANESAAFSGTYSAPADSCNVSTTVTAGGNDVCNGRAVNATSTKSCPVNTTPSIVVTKNCPDTATAPGGNYTYTGRVENTGNVTLNNVTVVANGSGGSNVRVIGPITLAPGQGTNFTATYRVPAGACSLSDRLTASATDKCLNRSVTSNVEGSCPVVTAQDMVVTLSCPTGTVAPGARIAYAGTVRNSGNVGLTNVVVRNGDATVFTVATLAAGASASFTANVTAPSNDCSVSTTVVASALDLCGGRGVEKSATATCTVTTAPAIAVTHDCPATAIEPNASGTFTGTVRNTGNITLTNVTVVSGGVTLFGPAVLNPNETAAFSGTYTAPADSCNVSTTVTANGNDRCTGRAVNATSTKSCPVNTTPSIVVTKNCPDTATLPGGNYTYTGRVENTGNVTLNNVTVVANGSGGSNVRVIGPITLAPGQGTNFTATYRVPAGACSLSDRLTASATDKCQNRSVTSNVEGSCPVVTAQDLVVTLSCPTGTVAPGSRIAYAGTVRNSGNVGLTNVVVRNGETTVFTVATLAAGASASFTANVTAPSNECSISTTVVASALDLCGGRGVEKSATASCAVTTAPAIAVTHDCPATAIEPGASGTFTGTVRNSGNITLTNVTVVSGGVTLFGPAVLNPNETAAFSGAFTAAADSCNVSTTVTAGGNDRCTGRAVNATSTKSCPVNTTPSIVVTKSCPDVAPAIGQNYTYKGRVQNTGNVTLNNVTVVANGSGGNNVRVFGPVTLAPGQGTDFTATYRVPVGACSLNDRLTASGTDKCQNRSVSNTVEGTCPILTAPAIQVTAVCPPGTTQAGRPVNYTGTVRNSGNVALTGVTVRHGDVVVLASTTLAPGASANFTGSVTAPANECNVSITVVANGTDQCGNAQVTQSATATCPIQGTPRLALSHDCPTDVLVPGGTVNFSGLIRNAGNVTLTNVVVRNGNTVLFGPATLDPDQSSAFVGTITAPRNGSCTITTALSASGNDRCNGASTAANSSTTCPVTTVPGIMVTKLCPPTATAQGAQLTYTGTVVNTGDVTLTNVVVVNSRNPGANVATFATLAPGESRNFTGSYIVPANCCSVTDTLTATARDVCGNRTVTDTATATCPVLFNPRIAVTKTCPKDPVSPGETLRYTGTVSNPGNITLVDVMVVNDHAGVRDTVLGPISLAPGQTVSFKHSYVVPTDFCGDDSLSARGVSICGNQEATSSVSTKCPVVTTPCIIVTKSCPVQAVPNGGRFTYTGTVFNKGDVTLEDVIVWNSAPTNNIQVAGPFVLKPGETREFSATYTIHNDCCDIVDVATARGRDRCSGVLVTNTASSVCPVETNPRIAVTKTCGVGNAFTGSVRNSGDITLSNVVVRIDRLGGAVVIAGPMELAPGESASFSGSGDRNETISADAVSICRSSAVVARANCEGAVNTSVSGPDITSVNMRNGKVVLAWKSYPGAIYRVQYKEDVGASAWKDVVPDVTATGASTEATDNPGANACRMYRVKLVQ